MTIHSGDPFATPDAARDPVRRLRGRVGGTVSLWCSGEGVGRAGLTVSSYLLAPGDPPMVAALVHPDAELLDAIRDTGTAVVQLLTWPDRQLAEVFAGLMPAPGGPFATGEWEQTGWGPRLQRATSWAGVRFPGPGPDAGSGADPGADPGSIPAAVHGWPTLGWSVLVQGVIEHVEVGPDEQPLVHRRGRYVRP